MSDSERDRNRGRESERDRGRERRRSRSRSYSKERNKKYKYDNDSRNKERDHRDNRDDRDDRDRDRGRDNVSHNYHHKSTIQLPSQLQPSANYGPNNKSAIPSFLRDAILKRNKEEEERKKLEEEQKKLIEQQKEYERLEYERKLIEKQRYEEEQQALLDQDQNDYNVKIPDNYDEEEDNYNVKIPDDIDNDNYNVRIPSAEELEPYDDEDDYSVRLPMSVINNYVADAPEVEYEEQSTFLKGSRNFDDAYEVLGSIDEGTYGVVYRAIDKETKSMVAVKKVKMEDGNYGFPVTSLREMNILMQIQHENIIRVREVCVGNRLSNVFMIMDFEDHDMKQMMSMMKCNFSLSEVKCLLKQLLTGIDVLHSNWVMHRDLKASNLLYSNNGVLKICDFGMARSYGLPLRAYTEVVCTLWYRAPEVLLGESSYGPEVDMWSVGCLFGEFMTKTALFAGNKELEQLDLIFKTLGTPNETVWPGVSNLRFFKQFKFNNYQPKLRSKFPRVSFSGVPLSDIGFDLLSKFLTYDPKKRITAKDALKHPFFNELPHAQKREVMPAFPSVNKEDRIEQRSSGIKKEKNLGGGLFE